MLWFRREYRPSPGPDGVVVYTPGSRSFRRRICMKKMTAVLMALILLFELLPLGASAESPLSESELAAAWALTGLEDVGTQHAVQSSSFVNMTGVELISSLRDLLDNEVGTLESSYVDIENTLAKLRESDSAAYNRLNSGRFSGMADLIHARFRKVVDARSTLEYWRSRLEIQAGMINKGIARLQESTLSDYEIRSMSYQIRQATAEIRSIRAEMTEQVPDIKALLDAHMYAFVSPESSSSESDASIASWVSELMKADDPVVTEASFSASSLFPVRQTLLGRLSPISSAQAEDENAKLRVLDDHTCLIIVHNENDKAIKGAKISIKDLRREKNPKTIQDVTDDKGELLFENTGFGLLNDRLLFSMEITADGYRTAVIDEQGLKKGGTFTINLKKDTKDHLPYIAGCSFDGRDCFYTSYNALYSSKNDAESPIRVTVINPSDQDCVVELAYQDADKKQYFHTMGLEDSAGKENTKSVTIPAGERKVLTTSQEWRRKLKPGGNIFTWSVDGKDVKDSKATVMQLVIHSSGDAIDKYKTGSPALKSGSYTIVPTQLTVAKAKMEQPLAGPNLIGSFFNASSNLFNFSFPVNKDDGPFAKVGSVGLDLPFSKFVPRIAVAIDGSTSIVVGTDAGNFTSDKGPIVSWKNQDAKDIEDSLTDQEKSNAFMKKIGQGVSTASMSYLNGGLSLKSVKGSIGLYVGLIYKLEYEAEQSGGEQKWTSKKLTGIAGFVPSLAVDLSYNTFVMSVPVFIGFSLNASLAVNFSIGGTVEVNSDADLDKAAISTSTLDPKYTGVSFLLSVMVTLYAGVGVKGLASISLNGYGYINLLLDFRNDDTSKLRIWMGFGIYVYLELLFLHYKQNIVDSPEVVLYDGTWSKDNASRTRVFSSLFLTGASAEESEPGKAVSLQATDYSDLTIDPVKEAGPVQEHSKNISLLEIEGEMFAFYLADQAGSSGRSRVTWLNLSTGATGTFDSALKRAADGLDLVKDPDGRITQEGRSRIQTAEKDIRATNAVLYGQDDTAFEVQPFRIYSGADRISSFYKSLYILNVFSADTSGSTESSISVAGTPAMYVLAFRPDGNHGLTAELRAPTPDDKANPGVTFNMLYSAKLNAEEEDLKTIITSGVSASAYISTPAPQSWNINISTAAANNLVVFEATFPVMTVDGTQPVGAKSYYCWPGVRKLSGRLTTGITPFGYLGNTFYQLEEKSDGSGKSSLTYRGAYESPIETDAEIPYYRVLGETEADYLFWLTTEKTQEKTLHHLKAAKLIHWPDVHKLPTHTFTDPDITIPGAMFNVQKIGSTIYVYWLESVSEKENSTDTIYRVCGVACDPSSGICSDDMVFAQFNAPGDGAISNMFLSDLGRGYFICGGAVYSFPFELKASMDLEAVLLQNDVIGEGENALAALRLVNNGNMAISSFSVIEYAEKITQTSSLSAQGEKVLTLTCDTVKPDNNRIHLEGDDPELDIIGRDACWRETMAADTSKQHYWEIKQLVRTFSSYKDYKDDTKTVSLDAMEILPGQVALFNMLIKVPSGWKGTTHQLTFALDSYSASASQVRSMALRSGLDTEAFEGAETVTWSRSANGTMQPETSLLSSGGVSLPLGETDLPVSAVLANDLDNLEVLERVYVGAAGESRLSMTISNETVDSDSIRLYCEVLLDDDTTPIYLDLPYDSASMANARTHTIDIPLSALSGGRKAHKAEVTIRGIGITETALLDNTFEVLLEEEDPLRITVQPRDREAAAGENVSMAVQAAGGIAPYTCQWQEYMGETLGWQNIQGAAKSTLTLEKVDQGMNGRRYRVVVTDQNLDSVISDEAVLTVRKASPTGDASHTLLYLLLAALLLLAWFLLRKKTHKE